MSDTQFMDDLIVIGEAVPDELKDKRKVLCSACYSDEHGLVRIYPIPPNAHMRRWDRVSIPLERNPQDTRGESWKVQGSKREWDVLSEKIHRHGKLPQPGRISLLHKLYRDFGVDCIQNLNDNMLSLGIIKPDVLNAWMEERGERYDPTVQITLDSPTRFFTIHNYKLQPRVKYRCSDCRSQNPHNQQILEWGAYEWMRKHPDNPEQAIPNLRLTDPQYDKYFLVGNMSKYRNAFVVISVFRFKHGTI